MLISVTSQLPIPTIKVTEDVKMTTKGFIFIEFDYRESTPLSNINETIIRQAKLNTLTLENNLSKIYNESRLSSKKRKRNINIYECDSSVSVTWKKNIANFSSRVVTTTNKSFLSKPI